LVAGPLQRARRVAVDIFLPAVADADLRAASLRPQPRPRRHSDIATWRTPHDRSSDPCGSSLVAGTSMPAVLGIASRRIRPVAAYCDEIQAQPLYASCVVKTRTSPG